MASSTFAGLLKPVTQTLQTAITNDREFQASAQGRSIKFGVKSSDADDALIVDVQKGSASVGFGSPSGAAFVLSARLDDWQKFFAARPPASWQSYWGILRIHGHNPGVQIIGDAEEFGKNARLWRLALDRARDAINDIKSEDAFDATYVDEEEEDSIVGRYTWIETPRWGRSKIFYESAGTGPQHILFLHTAGADSRQAHSLLNNRQMQARCTMFAFDLPGHGRSYPGTRQLPEGYTNDEENYVEAIAQVIKKLGLKRPIVSGASMAGHVCLAVAIRAKELGVSGVIPCEGCEHLPLTQPIYELGGDLNEAILNPERVCGMCAPTAPSAYKRLIWWIYSSQGVQCFQGDLKFYFKGWDGRGRVETIDTKTCPVYMLTGEYDYSCTPEASAKTAEKIPGAKFEMMKGLGHFPQTEDPKAFMPYMMKALDFIEEANGQAGTNGAH
ncbi:alpha/beta hydrolase fold family protein [Rhizodiscina lignyota]|uniref:Alpha/beta hydrolase fold family protein n=1 Tax=Rhizodiscina lignyota TaxID=1504668 RepID=A0A9P4IH23_9PEZI|nr:alpha/beta hydrolase fold family protein [Rhizodiscina lignyota]